MSDEHILVVGGLSGIGAGIVAAFGARCVVWSRRTGVDATDPAQVARALERIEAPFALLHCVGEFDERPLLGSEPGCYQRMVASNLTSAFVVMQAVVPMMVAKRRGRVVFFSAAGAGDGRAKTRAPLYFACKTALTSLARSLAAEVAGSGVTVNVISPGVIRHASSHAASQDRIRNRIPIGREGKVGDVLGAVKLLLSEDGAYITGADLTIDGGLSLG